MAKVISQQTFSNVEINDLRLESDGRVIGAGTHYLDCGTRTIAVLAEIIGDDLSFIHMSQSALPSRGQAIVFEEDGRIGLIGNQLFPQRVLADRPGDALVDADNLLMSELVNPFLVWVIPSREPTHQYVALDSHLRASRATLVEGQLLLVGTLGTQPAWILRVVSSK